VQGETGMVVTSSVSQPSWLVSAVNSAAISA